jgi:hypothetical protein
MKRTMTKRDTPAAKRASSLPPTLAREEPIDDSSPTVPIPVPWFKDHDSLYGEGKPSA